MTLKEIDNLLNKLRKEFPAVRFTHVEKVIEPKIESAFYPEGYPKASTSSGDFIRMENVRGGADTVPAMDVSSLWRLAKWHQRVAERHPELI